MDVAARGREFVRVAGPEAADYLQRMVSNDVEALAIREACPALLLTAKGRVIAPLVVLRRGDEDFLLLTEPGLGEAVRSERRALIERALSDGPGALAAHERRVLLLDPDATDELHERVWAIQDRELAARWGRPGAAAPAAA